MTELTNEQAAAEDELVQEIHKTLDRHFITVEAGQPWRCSCDRTFTFFTCAVEHQAAEVIALVSSRLAAAASDALIDAARELDRLHVIGTTRRDLTDNGDWQWFVDHPLQRSAVTHLLSTTVPSFSEWLRGRAGDDDQAHAAATSTYPCCKHCKGSPDEPCNDVLSSRRRHVEPCYGGCNDEAGGP